MIIDFSVRNFCSVDNEVTLSFVPSSRVSELSDIYYVEPKEGMKLLKFGTILGANASGKTTILRSLEILRMLVCNPYGNKTRQLYFYAPYWFGDGVEKTTDISIQFVSSKQVFHYSVSFNANCVVSERLRVLDHTWRTVYSRETNEKNQTIKIKSGIYFSRFKDDFKQLEKVTLWNNTVLGGSLKVSIDIPMLQEAVRWFNDYLYPMIDPDTNLYGYVSTQIDQGIISKSRLLGYLHGADMMIEDFVVKKDSWENLDEKMRMTLIESNPELTLEEIKQKFPVRHIEFVHSNGGKQVNVDYVEESLGTQRFYQLCGILDMLINQKCMFFIDEIDSSIHPDLLEYLLLTFLVNSKESQLLISTHHREWLMQEDYFRPDTVWFTEKHSNGSSHLYKLSDFKVINNFDRSFSYYDAYRKGLLGATPTVRNIFVIDDEIYPRQHRADSSGLRKAGDRKGETFG